MQLQGVFCRAKFHKVAESKISTKLQNLLGATPPNPQYGDFINESPPFLILQHCGNLPAILWNLFVQQTVTLNKTYLSRGCPLAVLYTLDEYILFKDNNKG